MVTEMCRYSLAIALVFFCEVRIHCHYLRSWEEVFEAKRKEKAQISHLCVWKTEWTQEKQWDC